MALNFPDPATQTPVNTFSPTSTPDASTNGITYLWDGQKWNAQGAADAAFWQRVGTTLSPVTAGDNISTTGDISSADVTASSEVKAPSLLNAATTGDPNITLYADGSTSIRNLQNSAYNVIINGEMSVDQYGTLSQRKTNNSVGGADRWFQRLNFVTAEFVVSLDPETPPGFNRSLKWDCKTQAASLGAGEFAYLSQKIEGINCQLFAKGTTDPKPFTVSFWVRSSVTGTYAFRLADLKNNRQIGKSYTVDTANTWEFKTLTFPGESANAELDNNNTAQLALRWWLAAGSDRTSGSIPTAWKGRVEADEAAGHTANLSSSTSNTFFITGIQLTATDGPIEFQHENVETTLAKCQRYFQKIGWKAGSMTGTYLHPDTFYSNPAAFIVEMRSAPDGELDQITAGQFYWVDPGQNSYSSASTGNISMENTSSTWALRQKRTGTGSLNPAKFATYVLEAGCIFRFDAEF